MDINTTNEENCPIHVNQAQADVLVADAQAPPPASVGPPIARRKGRSFGASVIAHLGPEQASQLASCSKSPICTQQAVAVCMASTPTQDTAVTVPKASPLQAAPSALASVEHNAPSAIQPVPTLNSRRSHGAAMIASLACKTSPQPSTPSQAHAKPAASTKPPPQRTEVSTHAQNSLTNTASGDAALKHCEPGSAACERGTPSNATRVDDDDTAVADEGIQAPSHSPQRQTSDSAPRKDDPAPLVDSKKAVCIVDDLACNPDNAQHPVAIAPDAPTAQPVQFDVLSDADDCPMILVPTEPGGNAKSPGLDAERDNQTLQPESNHPSGLVLESPPPQMNSRPKGTACKPVRGSHGTAMLLQLCSKLPSVSPAPLEPAKAQGETAIAATQRCTPPISQDMGPPHQGTGSTGAIEAAHAPHALVLAAARAPSPAVEWGRRSAGASMIASIKGNRHGYAGGGSNKSVVAVQAVTAAPPTLQHEQEHQAAFASKEIATDRPAPLGKALTMSVPASSDMHPSSSGAVCPSVDIWIRPGAASPRTCDADSGALTHTAVAMPEAPATTAPCATQSVTATAVGTASVQFNTAAGTSQTDSDTVRKTLSMFATHVVSRPCERAGAATALQAGDDSPADVPVEDDATPTPLHGVVERECAAESPDAADVAQVTPRQRHRRSTLSTPLESGSASSGSPPGRGNTTCSRGGACMAPTTAELQHLSLARSSLKRREPTTTASPDSVLNSHKRHRRAPRALDMAIDSGDTGPAGGPGCGGNHGSGAGADTAQPGVVMPGFCNSDSPMICGASQEEDAQRSIEVTPKLLETADMAEDEMVSDGAPDVEEHDAAASAAALAAGLGDGSVHMADDDDTTTPCPDAMLSEATQSAAPLLTAAGTGALWSVATGARPPSGTPLTAVSLPPILQHCARAGVEPEQAPWQPQSVAVVKTASAQPTPAMHDMPHAGDVVADVAQQERPMNDDHGATAAAAECVAAGPAGSEDAAAREATAVRSPVQTRSEGGVVGTPDQPTVTTFMRIGITPVRQARNRRGGRPVRARVTLPRQPAAAGAPALTVPKRVSPRLLKKRASPGTGGAATAGSFSRTESAQADPAQPSGRSIESPAVLVRPAEPEQCAGCTPACDGSAEHDVHAGTAEVPADAAALDAEAPQKLSLNLESPTGSAVAIQGGAHSGDPCTQAQTGMPDLGAPASRDMPGEPERGQEESTQAPVPDTGAVADRAAGGPPALAPSPLLQGCEPPGPGHEDSPCTAATPAPGNMSIERGIEPPADLLRNGCTVKDTRLRDGTADRDSMLTAGPSAQTDSSPLCVHTAYTETGLDNSTAASVAVAEQHCVQACDAAGSQLQDGCMPPEARACKQTPATLECSVEGGLQDAGVPQLEQMAAAEVTGHGGTASEVGAEEQGALNEEVHVSAARAILFDPDVESPRACSAPVAAARPCVSTSGTRSAARPSEEADADPKLQAPPAAAASCEPLADAAPSSGVIEADGVMHADGDLESGFRRKRILSPSKVPARGRSRPAPETIHHTSAPKLSRGQLFQAAALKGCSPTGDPRPSSSPLCGAAMMLNMHTPPGSYNSPVLHLDTSPTRPGHNSSSPLFSAAVGVMRSPSRSHGGHSYHASAAARGLMTSPQRRAGGAPLQYGSHLQSHPPASPGRRSPGAAGPPVAPRSPVRMSSGASAFHHGMEDGQLPATSPLLGPGGNFSCSRKWQWRRGRAPGYAAPLGPSATAALRSGLGHSRPRRRRCRLSPAAPSPPALEAMRVAFLDLQLATAASRGQPWATLNSSGVPFPNPLDLPALAQRLAAQAAAASGGNPAADVTAALQAAREDWTALQASRVACWQRRSGSAALSADAPQPADEPPSATGACGGGVQPSSGGPVEGQPRRGLLKRSPLPSVCAGAPPLAPLLEAGLTLTMGTPPGSLEREGGPLAAPGSHGALEPPMLPLFQQNAPVEEGPEELRRQRSVRFSDQAAVKHYENTEEPSRVAGEPEGHETVATRSPQKSFMGYRRKRRRVGAPNGAAAADTSEDADEIEDGEVVEGSAQMSPILDLAPAGTSMYAL